MKEQVILYEDIQTMADVLEPGQDPVNTEVTDETLNLLVMAEPASIWGAASGQLDVNDIYVCSALLDTLALCQTLF